MRVAFCGRAWWAGEPVLGSGSGTGWHSGWREMQVVWGGWLVEPPVSLCHPAATAWYAETSLCHCLQNVPAQGHSPQPATRENTPINWAR